MLNVSIEELNKISYQNIKKILRKESVEQAKELMGQVETSLQSLYESLDGGLPIDIHMKIMGRIKKFEMIYRYLYERVQFIDYEKEYREDIKREKAKEKKWW